MVVSVDFLGVRFLADSRMGQHSLSDEMGHSIVAQPQIFSPELAVEASGAEELSGTWRIERIRGITHRYLLITIDISQKS